MPDFKGTEDGIYTFRSLSYQIIAHLLYSFDPRIGLV
jgi:hypothetical protein